MKVQITNQTNEQECGVCVLTSLHNYFYKNEKLTKEKVLDKCQVDKNGISIIDFEVLGNKLGLQCESYEINWSEFLALKISNYFVLLLSTTNSSNHYIIAKKTKKGIELYDSCYSKPKILSFDEIKTIFIGLIILVNKNPNKLFTKTFGKASTLLLFDVKFVLINLFLSLLILVASIVAASFLNWVIDLAISKSSINNLLTISFIFLLSYVVNDILNYVSSLYTSSQTKTYLTLFTSKILNSISKKTPDFLFKVDKDWIFKIDECVYNISTFCVVEINKMISNIIFCLICICLIGTTNYWLLIFCVVFGVIELIFFLLHYKNKKEIFLSIVRSENKNTSLYKQLIHNLKNEVWNTKRSKIIHKIKENYSTIYKSFNQTILFKNNTNLFKSLFKGFSEVALILAMGYLIIQTKSLSIGNMTFVIAAFSLYRSSLNDVCNYFLSKLEFDVYWQVYKDLTTVSNLKNNVQHFYHQNTKSICFNLDNKKIFLSNDKGTYKTQFSGSDLLLKSSSILIDKQKININEKIIYDSFVLLNEKAQPNTELLLELIEKNVNLYIPYIHYFNLDLNKTEQSFIDSLIVNLLTLLNEKNKIILVDNVLHFIDKRHTLVIKEIINKIQKNNLVFILRKEENDKTKH